MKSLQKRAQILNTKKAQGFSLIELLLVIAIIAILAIAAFIIFPQVQASSRANTERSNINTIAACAKSAFNGRYTGLSNATAISAECAPSSMVSGVDGITSSWGQPVTVTGAPTTFTIAYDALPKSVCLKLVPGLLNNFDSVAVGGATLNKDSIPTAVITACQNPGDMVVTSN